jgi:hypothetical protein
MSNAKEVDSTVPDELMLLLGDSTKGPTSDSGSFAGDESAEALTLPAIPRPRRADDVLSSLEGSEAGLVALRGASRYFSTALDVADRAHEQLVVRVQQLLELVESLRLERDNLQQQVNAHRAERRKLREAARADRERLIEEQDRFIQLLLDEQEQSTETAQPNDAIEQPKDSEIRMVQPAPAPEARGVDSIRPCESAGGEQSSAAQLTGRGGRIP